MLENPGEDEKGYTAWFPMDLHPGSVIQEEGSAEAIPKDKWAEKGIKGGMYRLAFIPLTCREALVYLQVAPVDAETFRKWLEEKNIPEQFSGVPAIRLQATGNTPWKIRLGPREPGNDKIFSLPKTDDLAKIRVHSLQYFGSEFIATRIFVTDPDCRDFIKISIFCRGHEGGDGDYALHTGQLSPGHEGHAPVIRGAEARDGGNPPGGGSPQEVPEAG